MEIRRLPEPIPRASEESFQPFEFRKVRVQYLPIPTGFPTVPLITILRNRKTSRTFAELETATLSKLLWMTMKVERQEEEESGFKWQHRPLPSAGGRHPVHALIIQPHLDLRRPSLYDPEAHALNELVPADEEAVSDALAHIEQLVPIGQASVVWFAADYERTLSRYSGGESLVWRDAGAVLAGFTFVAEALELNCCPIGLTGDEWIQRLFGTDRFGGVGGLLIGSRPAESSPSPSPGI
jgi:SagB-type dehydrogenase family enzyme